MKRKRVTRQNAWPIWVALNHGWIDSRSLMANKDLSIKRQCDCIFNKEVGRLSPRYIPKEGQNIPS